MYKRQGDGGANPDSVSGWSTGDVLARQVQDLSLIHIFFCVMIIKQRRSVSTRERSFFVYYHLHHVSGSHYVKCTDEEFAKWCK